MPSPFPGMNPYLEHPHIWHDFHQQFCIDIRTMLLPAIGPSYFCRLDEHIYIHDFSDEPGISLRKADVAVVESTARKASHEFASTQVLAPVQGRIETNRDVEREVFLEIRHRETQKLITVIEVLSLANKRRGPDREEFLNKRSGLLLGNAHYVEIDLLRAGPRLPMEGLPPCDFYALTSRVETRPQVDLWPCRLRECLPVIAVPLQSPDPAVALDLQAVLQESYHRGGYAAFIYDLPVKPPLSPADQTWADQILKSK